MAIAFADATGVVPNSSAGYPRGAGYALASGQAGPGPACPPTSTLLSPTAHRAIEVAKAALGCR